MKKWGITVFRHFGKRKWLSGVLSLVVVVVIASAVVDVQYICAHSPHDVIDAIDISPNYHQDQTLLISIGEHLLKSTDGGFSWKELAKGLDNKHYFSSIVISPDFTVDQNVFVSSDGDGIYRSQDGGASWDKFNQGLDNLGIGLLAVSQQYASDGIVLAAGTRGGLYRTDDSGENWDEVIDQGTRVTAIAFSPDSNWALTVIGDATGQVWFSHDAGATWVLAYQIPEAGAVTTIAVSDQLSEDETFFVGTEQRGIFKARDEGKSFVQLEGGASQRSVDIKGWQVKIRPPDHHVMSLALSPHYGQDKTILASTWWKAVYKSEDGGKTWKRHDTGVTCDVQANTEAHRSPHFMDLKVSRTFKEDGTIFLGGFDGLFKSVDGGRTWMQLETLPLRRITGMGMSPAIGHEFSVAITTYGGGAYITEDQGATWAANNSGLKETRLVDVTFSPAYASDNTVFSGVYGALLKSTDGADSWDTIPLDKVEELRPYPTIIVLSPNFAVDQTMYFGTRRRGIFKSVDGGLNPLPIWDGMGQVIISLVMSPDFVADGTLFAGVRDKGVYKTEDWGETWQPANNGLTFIGNWNSTNPPAPERDLLLAISPNYKEDRTVFAGSARVEGLFKTTDGGGSWQKLAEKAYGADGRITGIAISPHYKDDKTLIVSVKGKGLFRSNDGGRAFVKIGSDLIDNNHTIKLIQFSPAYATDKTVYAASDEELFKSTDGGNTWQMLARPIRYEDMREVVRYEGKWKTLRGNDFSANSVSYSDVAHAKAVLHFVGTGVSWIGTQADDHGIARVYVDGDHVGDVDQFSETRKPMVRSFSITDLAYGSHIIAIEATHTRNLKSRGYRIEIDAFDIMP